MKFLSIVWILFFPYSLFAHFPPGTLVKTFDGLASIEDIYQVDIGEAHHRFSRLHEELYACHAFPIVITFAWAFGSGIEFLWGTIGVSICGAIVGLAIEKQKEKHTFKAEPTNSKGGDTYGGSPDPDEPDPFRKNNRNYTNNVDVHPNGLYHDANYHTRYNNGLKNARPLDGQKTLDNSIPYGLEGHRIAIENDMFVVLRKTSPGLYHGHVRIWDELDPDMKNAVREEGWIRPKSGKIIK